MATLLRRRDSRRTLVHTGRQRGEILIVTLVCLLVCLLGLIYAMRGTLIDSQVTGNNLAKQKGAQTSDIALRSMVSQILAIYAGRPLELSANAQPWWRDVAAGTAAPDAAYWAACLGNTDATRRCAQFTLMLGSTALPYRALAVVQATGRSDATSCSLPQYQAVFYDIHLQVSELTGATSATTQTVYKVCTYS